MKMIKVKTEELAGAQLNWAVGVADGKDVQWFDGNTEHWAVRVNNAAYSPSIDGRIAMTIIMRENIDLLSPSDTHPYWRAIRFSKKTCCSHLRIGATPSTAAMRCFVASMIGDEVEVPAMDGGCDG